MEAVPKLPMLSVELKVSPENTEFGPQLKKYIRDHYNEDPESYTKEIKDLEALRVSAIRVPRDYTGCSTLKRYYSQLYLLQRRFPMTDDGAACVPFMWSDIYSGMVFNITDITYEQACILYNIGALHSELGAMDRRQTSEGMKISCTHFQCSAWAFQHLRDNYPQPKGSDMSHDLLTFFINIMLGQAQECILEKSMLDNRKSTIIAKVAAQIVDYYKIAQKTLESGSKNMESGCIADIVGSKLFKSWQRYVQFKMTYHSCIAYLYMGNQAEEQQKMGERLGYFQAAIEKLNESMKMAKGLEKEEISEALTFTMDVVGGKFETAKKENEFIYHEKVPTLESLPEIKGASLVKGIPFQPTDPEVSGQDIFSRLVPMEMHEASSLYRKFEEKAKILRKIAHDIGEKDQELVTYLASLQLDQLKLTSETEQLPQELIECCAALSVKPNVIKDLVESMKRLSNLFHDVESNLDELQLIFKEEEEREKKYQDIIGKRGPSMILLEIQKEISKYQEAHAKANESNNNLHKAMNLHLQNLRLLTLPLDEIQKALPSLSILDAPNDEASLKELQRLKAKIEEMKNQRQMLETQLREEIQNDDITKRLVAEEGTDLQELFKHELKKHEKTLTLLEQNLAAQDNILKALTAANACYADTRKLTTDIIQKRENMIKSLISSYEAYEDLLAKSQRGFEFYRKLEGNVSKLLQRTRSVCKVQEEERQQMLAKLKPKAPPVIPVTSADKGPKLKDYLQYMQPTSKHLTPTVPNIIPTTSISQPLNPLMPSSEDRSIPSISNIAKPDNSSTYDIAPNAMTAMYLPRPTPLGSEHSDSIPSQCSSLAGNKNYPVADYALPYSYPASQTGPEALMHSIPNYSQNQNKELPPPSSFVHSSTPYSSVNLPQKDYSQLPSSNVSGIPTYMSSATTSTYHLPYQVTPISTTFDVDQPWQTAAQPPLPQGNSSVNALPQSFQQPYQHPGMIDKTEQYPPQVPSPAPYGSSQYVPLTIPSTAPSYYSGLSHSTIAAVPQTSLYSSSDYSHYPYSPDPQFSGIYFQQNIPVIPSSTMSNLIQPSPTASSYPYNNIPATMDSYYNVTTTTTTVTATQNGRHLPSESVPQYTQAGNGTADTRVASGYLQYNNQNQQPQTPLSSQVLTSSGLIQPHPYMSDGITTSYTQPAVPAPTQYQTVNINQNNFGTSYQSTISAPENSSSSTITTQSQLSTQRPGAGSDLVTSNVSQLCYYPGTYSTYCNDPSKFNTNTTNFNSTHTTVSPSFNTTSYPYTQFQPTVSQTPTPISSHMNCSFSSVQNITTISSIVEHSNSSVSNVHLLNQLQTNEKTLPETDGSKVTTSHFLVASVTTDNYSSVSGTTSLTSVSASSACSVQKPRDDTDTLLHSFDPMQEDFTVNVEILKPKILAIHDIQQKNISKQETQRISKDPYSEPEVLNRFVADVERFEKVVEGLTKQSLKGPTPLDQKWKELIDTQDRESRKLAISVARCYSFKNRLADVMPYDVTRVKLNSIQDDYINASYIKEISQCPVQFIATQAPLPSTYADFWLMTFEQQSEIIICLMSDAELKNHIYWPKEKNQQLTFGLLNIGLQSIKTKPWGTERMVTITQMQTRITRVVIHLQCSIWPPSENPSNICHFLLLVSDTLNYYQQQRNLSRPIIVHCSAGIGRTGVFCLSTAAVLDISAGRGIMDISSAASQMTHMRKSIIQDKNQLQFCYGALLYYAQDLLMKRGILSSKPTFEDKLPTTPKASHTRHPSEDFILGLNDLNKLKSGVDKLGTEKSDDMPSSQNENKISKDEKNNQKDIIDTTDDKNINNVTEDNEIKRLSISQEKTVKDDDNQSIISGLSEQILSRSNSVASVASVASSGSLAATDSPQHSTNKGPILPASLAKLDPASFSLEPMPAKGKRKITRESFLNPIGSSLSKAAVDVNDPLSQLDPLWTHHK